MKIMKPKTINESVKEAQRFIKLAKSVIDEHKLSGYEGLYGSKATGALRRASMDLTRSLAEMRRP